MRTARLAAGLASMRMGVRWTSTRTLLRWTGRLGPRRPIDIDDTARIVFGLARRSGTTCLPRALTLRWALRRHGLPAELVIGHELDGSDLDGHAWVELDDAVVGEAEDTADQYPRLQARLG